MRPEIVDPFAIVCVTAPVELGGGGDEQGDVAVERLATAERKPPASFASTPSV